MAEDMSIERYLAQGGKLTNPANVPPRYRAELLNDYRLAPVGSAICFSKYRSTMSSVMAPLVVEKYPLPQNRQPQ